MRSAGGDVWTALPIGDTSVEREALRLWREEQRDWPAFVRRPVPDGLDLVSGAWARIMAQVEAAPAAADLFERP